MLVACPTCHRQYDVGDHTPGTKIRCHCGLLCTVPEPRSRQIDMAHCSQCGGRLEPGATTCAYCQAEVTLGDRGLGQTCPECFARMVKGAGFCSSCGTAIAPEAVLKALAATACPRCDGELTLCESPSVSFTECTACGGVWLEAGVFDRLAAEHTRTASSVLPGHSTQPVTPPTPEQQVRYLRCPVCECHMNRRNFATTSGVVIDWCWGHGYWFDVHELQAILDFIAAGGLDEAQLQRAQLNQEDPTRTKLLLASLRASQSGRDNEHGREPVITFVDLVIDFLIHLF